MTLRRGVGQGEEPAVSSGGKERAVLHLLLEKNSFGYLTFSLLATHTSKWVWYLGFHCWRQSNKRSASKLNHNYAVGRGGG